MKLLVLMSLNFIAACGLKSSRLDYGKVTVSQLVSEKGEPLKESKIPLKDGRILQYEKNEKYQVKGEMITHGFRDPEGDEKNLIYWRHKFRDCDSSQRKLEQKDMHQLPEYELKCGPLGITVIYTEGSEFVSRIIEHEKK